MQDKKRFFVVAFWGVVIGIFNGLFGGGGGMVCVPILVSLLGFEQKNAHATAVFIMLPISIASSIVYMTNIGLSLSKNIWLILGVVVGGLIGGKILGDAKNNTISIIFAVIMLVAGLKMLF